ncbi:MAG: CapA family protein, partial [Deltaproteobacteria bacterium]|nr:CapA family protein [Deltaproteobacteria bacterium]
LACSGLETRTPPNSAYPAPAPASPRHQAIESCSVRAARPTVVQGFTIRPRLAEGQFVDGEVVLEGRKPGAKGWNVVAKQLRSLAKGSFGVGKARRDFLFTLEAHPSSIDHETSPRPYVYDVGPHGLIARWRGSALAWPLVDGELLRGATARDSDYLCALHRKDSFVALDPTTKETRTALYRWNGFGFSGVDDRKLEARCASLFAGNVLGYPHE